MEPRRARSTILLLLTAAAAVLASGSMTWPGRGSGGDPPVPRASAATSTSTPAPGTGPAPAAGPHPGLTAALDAATAAARRSGHRLTVTSGHRTVAEQEALLAEAVARHGPVEAQRWVFSPDRSMHVRGLAADVGDRPAAAWLEDHGARFGLCRTLAWEWWHFEWRPGWEAAATCPPPVDDPTDAPG